MSPTANLYFAVSECRFFCTVVHALDMVESLEIEEHPTMLPGSGQTDDKMQGLCSSKRVLSLCGLTRLVEEVLSLS